MTDMTRYQEIAWLFTSVAMETHIQQESSQIIVIGFIFL